jgi:C-terminal processing protease CtpA/Prc
MFDDLWREFDLHYSYFALKPVDWDSLGTHYRPLAVAARNDAAFGAVLGTMVGELRDLHVAVTAGDIVYRYRSLYELTGTPIIEGLIFTKYVESSFVSSGGHIRGGRVAPEVGYLRINSFIGEGWSGEMDDALSRLGRVDALIIDVRDNSGGSKQTATEIAGRFADRERTFGYVRLRNGPRHDDFSDDIVETVKPAGSRRFFGPVIVLTNRGSMSAAEDFTLAMHTLSRATIVGDTTAGASGGPLVRELANGWTYQMSQWIAYTADHRIFEGIGLAPDLVVKAGADWSIDRPLETAIEIASSR